MKLQGTRVVEMRVMNGKMKIERKRTAVFQLLFLIFLLTIFFVNIAIATQSPDVEKQSGHASEQVDDASAHKDPHDTSTAHDQADAHHGHHDEQEEGLQQIGERLAIGHRQPDPRHVAVEL